MSKGKVLLVTDFSYPLVGGTERIVFRLAKFLNENGFEAQILSPHWQYLKDKENLSFKESHLYSDPSNKESILDVEGVKIHRFSFPFMKNGFVRAIAYMKKIRELDCKEGFDLVHGFFIMSPVVGAILGAKSRGKKSVSTFFELEPIEPYLKNPLSGKLVKRVIRKTDYITTLSWVLERRIKGLFWGVKSSTVPGFVEPFFKETGVKKKGKQKVILFVGRVSEQKGCHILLQALPKVRKKVDAVAWFVGPQWEKEKFGNLVKGLGLENAVFFKGFASGKKLVEFYNSADVFVLPSIRKEGFGLVLVEAMKCGVPVIGSTDGGIPDAVGDAGIVVEKNSVNVLSKAIIKLLTDKKLCAEFRRKGFKRAELFEEKRVLQGYLKIYEEVGVV